MEEMGGGLIDGTIPAITVGTEKKPVKNFNHDSQPLR